MSARNNRLVALTFGLALFASIGAAQLPATNGDLPNFHQINQTFFRGGQPTENGFRLLAGMGVKTIINLRGADEGSEAEEKRAQALGLRYLNFPMKERGRPADAQVQAILAVVNAAGNQPVFLHCHRGKDRTGTVVACYRIAHDHWTSPQAIKEARQLGMQWSEFGMKNFVADFSRRAASAGGKGR